jgi:hypothetical protein
MVCLISFFSLFSDLIADFYSISSPFYQSFPHSSMNSIFSWVILLFLWFYYVRSPLCTFFKLLINSYSITSKRSCLLWLLYPGLSSRSYTLRLNVIQRWSKVNVDISVNYANGIVIIFRCNLQYVNLEFVIKYLNADGIALVQTSEISKLILEYGFRILHIDEFGLMRL